MKGQAPSPLIYALTFQSLRIVGFVESVHGLTYVRKYKDKRKQYKQYSK